MKSLKMDVSRYDAENTVAGKVVYTPVDWNKTVQIGVQVAAIKMSEGGLMWRNNRYEDGAFIDPAFRIQWAAAAGRPRVAYHFFRSNRNAILQARDALAIWNSVEHTADDRIALDFETMDGMSGKSCLAAAGSWLYEVNKATGLTPFIYTYPNFWLNMVEGSGTTSAAKYPLWLGQWPLDIWIAGLFPINIFGGSKLTDLLAKIQNGQLVPLSGRPYYGVLEPWGKDIDAWQFSARIDTKSIPGHPALKKVADMSVIYKPWWTGVAQQPTPIPVPVPVPVPAPSPTGTKYAIGAMVAYAINARSGPGSSYALVKVIVKSDTPFVYITSISGGWGKLADGNGWVYMSFLEKA